jgi:hypothetical protein
MKFFTIIAALTSVKAWSGPAHLLTARIAEEILKVESPEKIE